MAAPRRSKESANVQKSFMAKTKTDVLRFAEYDLDGNQKLDFDEFYAFQPKRLLERFSRQAIRVWFDSADKDGNGTLCLNEFFIWTLENASTAYGTAALEKAFSRYDADGTGQLDSVEFARACNALGFGPQAQELFLSLDADGSGLLSYTELVEALRTAVPTNAATKQMLSAMVLEAIAEDDGASSRPQINTSGWTVTGSTAADVRAELREQLKASGALVGDLMRLFDTDANPLDITIDDVEFVKAMHTHFRFKGPPQVLHAVFASMDTDSSGVIGFDELYEFIQGRRHSLDQRNRQQIELRLDLPAFASLDSLRWDGPHGVHALRILLMEMLLRCGRPPADLLRTWARSVGAAARHGRVCLTRARFVSCLHYLFAAEDPDLWDAEVKAAAEASYEALVKTVPGANLNRGVGVAHFERWLEFPLEARHLKRLDESPDTQFYSQPRVNVQHIDQYAVLALSKLYAEELPAGGTVLDIMSSWTSHLAQGKGQDKADGHFARVSAVGMHDDELKANPALHDYVVHDMNAQPRLAMYADASFDAVFCSVSVDYLSAPLPIFREIHRVLKPGGLALFTWSNRMFPTKAITAWREASEPARLWICGSYFHYSVPGGFSAPTGRDLSPYPGRSDPVYAVSARKVAAPADGGKQEL